MNKACDIDFTIPALSNFTPDCIDLLQRMLKRSPEIRISAAEALKHSFF